MYYDTRTQTNLQTWGQVLGVRPNVSIPPDISDTTLADQLGILKVVENKVIPDEFQRAIPQPMVMINGVPTINYTLIDIPISEAIANKVKEIDINTSSSIISLAGDEAKQRNLIAKSVELLRAETRGTITAEGLTELDNFNSIFTQIENLRVLGNDKESQIKACRTIKDLRAKCIELGV